MVTKVITTYLFIWENDLNEILYLIQLKYYFGKDLIFSSNIIWGHAEKVMTSPHNTWEQDLNEVQYLIVFI